MSDKVWLVEYKGYFVTREYAELVHDAIEPLGTGLPQSVSVTEIALSEGLVKAGGYDVDKMRFQEEMLAGMDSRIREAVDVAAAEISRQAINDIMPKGEPS